jgi:tRNA(Ile)-lysidine synthase
VNTRNPDLDTALDRSLSSGLDCSDSAAPAGLLIGFSGGLDSTVLLALAKQHGVATQTPVRALYIDHQLHADSARWRDHCAGFCAALDIEFASISVDLGGAAVTNLEEVARDARYAAFAQQLRGGEWLLTAHHADDQAETLLLQLLRGAGVQGMAAMPPMRKFAAGFHWRPLLDYQRDDLLDYARRHQLSWIEDPSNDDNRFDRNLIRRQVMPLLQQRWPAAVANLCRSARHCASAASLLVDIAQMDLADFAQAQSLPVSCLQGLDSSHLSNLLRCWIQARGHRLPSEMQLDQILRSLVLAGDDRIGDVQWRGGQMRRYADTLYLAARGALNDAPAFDHVWQNLREPLYIPELQQTLTADCLPADIGAGPVRVHSRCGGERFFVSASSTQRKRLKKWFQEQRIPPWQRNRVVVFSRADTVLGIHGPV